jgi:hypothetical protein
LLSKNIKIKIYRTIILPIVLYGCETWSLTLREERRLRVLRIFGPTRYEITWEWTKQHNEELNDLYYPNIIGGDQIQNNVMGGACSTYGGDGRCIQGFGGKPNGKRPIGRPTRRCEDNNKMDLQEV